MFPHPLLLLALPLTALAQSTNTSTTPAVSSTQPSQTIITSTFLSTQLTLGEDRQASTATRTFVFTTTQNINPPQQSNTAGNNTSTGNSTASSSTTTTPSNLPTAPVDINGGGQGGAPVPGQTGVGGIYGPDDNYIAGAAALKRNAWMAGVLGVVIGGAMAIY